MRFLTALSAAVIGVSLPLTSLANPPAQTAIFTGHFPALAPKATPSTIDAAARALVAEKAPWSAALTLGTMKIQRLASGERIARLRQLHQGVPVVQRGATVAFKADGAARLVAMKLTTDLPSSITPSITRVSAVAAAKARTGIGVDPKTANLAIWPSPDGAVLAWIVYAPTTGLPYAPVVAIDATTGEVIQHYNAVKFVNQAQVYETNPVKSPTPSDVTLPVGQGETTLQNELLESRNCIDKKTVKSISVYGFNLDVHTCDLLQTALPDANGDYLIAPGGDKDPEDSFSEVSMFHHANRAYDYFRSFQADFKVQDAPLHTVSNLRLPDGYEDQNPSKLSNPDLPLVPFSNAFFSPADPLFEQVFGIQGATMWFGQGPNRDYSYDGDVVYHEFTHAVVEATLQLSPTPHLDEYGVSYSPGAMNEGLADFFAAAIGGDPDIGEYASKDFAPGADAIRSLDNADACPTSIGGEVHLDSTLFSGALWKVRSTLSPAKQAAFDAAVFAAMNSSPTGDLGYEELAKLIASAITADATLGQAVATALDAEYTTRGVLPHCTRIFEYAGEPVNGPDDYYGMFTSPGTSTTGNKVKGYAPGIVQVHADLPTNPTTMTVTFKKGLATGGGGGFGQGGTPFKPKLLVRFGADPITFEYKPFKAADGVLEVDVAAEGSKFTASLDVPADATGVYFMVANEGQSDGTYMSLALDVESGAGAGGAGGTGGSSNTGGSGGSGGAGGATTTDQPKAAPKTEEIGGCGCSVPSTSTGGGLAGLGLAALALLRRRRARS